MPVKLELMSKSIVSTMNELAKNEGLARLLVNNVSNPFDNSHPTIDKSKLIIPNSGESKIYPYPFDPQATVNDGSFIRVYYNNGELDTNEAIAESQIHIDIIVAKNLWLINDGENSLIRPYEILGRVIDMVGKNGLNENLRLDIKGWQHLSVNTKFDAIRLYCEYFTVEA